MAGNVRGNKRLRLVLLALVLAASLVLEVVVHFFIGVDIVYTHFFYIAIVLAGLWYGMRAVPVGAALGAVHVGVSYLQNGAITTGALSRALMFVVVAAVVGFVAERIRLDEISPFSRKDGIPADAGTEDLIIALQSRNAETRYEAAVALGKQGDPEGIEPLEEALFDPEPGVRWVAMEALGAIGEPALETLISLLSSAEVDIRWGAAIALGDIGNPGAVGPLAAALEDEDRYVRTRAALALAAIGEPAIAALETAADTGSPEARWAAALALGKMDGGAGVPALSRLLADPDAGVRWKAAEALGAVGGDEAVAPLVAALGDADEEVRGQVAAALAARGEPAVGALIDALGQHDYWFGAVEALRRMQEKAEPALLAALERKNRWVRIGAAMILGERGDERGVNALLAALSDSDPDVVEAAREILSVGLKKEINHGS